MSANGRLQPVVYAEDFGLPSEVWLWRQVRASGVPVLTHRYHDPETFPLDEVWVVPRARGRWDRVRALGRLAAGGHGYRLPATVERAVVERVRAEGATLIHAHFGPAGLRMLPVARRLGIPLVVTFHGFDVTSLPEQDRNYRRALRELFAYGRCIAVSDHVRQRLERLGCRNARVLPLGTPLPARTAGNGGGPVRVLTVARLIALKGIPDLVDAVRSLDADVELHIVGEGPDRANIEARAAGDPRIILHGRMGPGQVAEQLARADVFVLNSRTSDEGAVEGFPISVLEAMAAGVSVIGTRHGGIPESVVDGETGLLVPERDVAALRGALDQLVRDPQRRTAMGDAGRSVVEERYELQACTARLREFYDEIGHG